MTAPNTAENVWRGIPSQSAQVPYSRDSSTSVSPTSKNTAVITKLAPSIARRLQHGTHQAASHLRETPLDGPVTPVSLRRAAAHRTAAVRTYTSVHPGEIRSWPHCPVQLAL